MARGTALALKNGIPYLAFLDFDDGENNDRISVMRDSGGWTGFGPRRFSGPINWSVALAIPPNGKPCVASYEHDDISRYLYVYQYGNASGTGSAWTRIGDQGNDSPIIEDSGLNFFHLAADSSGGLYVSYNTQAVSPARNVVKKYHPLSNSWDVLNAGQPYVDDGSSYGNGFFCDGTDIYVAYLDDSDTNAYKIAVKKFDRASRQWKLYRAGKFLFTPAANEGFQALSLYVHEGTPYVAYVAYDPATLSYNGMAMKCQ
jgi:hypothetical protein